MYCKPVVLPNIITSAYSVVCMSMRDSCAIEAQVETRDNPYTSHFATSTDLSVVPGTPETLPVLLIKQAYCICVNHGWFMSFGLKVVCMVWLI
jgi:hypothetical protein